MPHLAHHRERFGIGRERAWPQPKWKLPSSREVSEGEVGGESLCTTSASKGEECNIYSGTNKSLARPGRKQITAREDFDVHKVKVSRNRPRWPKGFRVG